MKRLFISHRSTDKEYADALVQFLKNIGYSTDEIFYTSADSTGVNYYLGTEVKTALNDNIDVLNKMVCRIMECSAKQIPTEMTNVKAEKIIDLDHLIEAKYYSDIELLMFKFIIDKGYCFNDSRFNIWEKVSQWEIEMKLNKSLSEYVDTVLNSFVNKGFATYTKYSGDKLNSEYKLKDQIFRELLQIDDKTKSALSRIEKKYKLSLIERMRIKHKNFAERMGISI